MSNEKIQGTGGCLFWKHFNYERSDFEDYHITEWEERDDQ